MKSLYIIATITFILLLTVKLLSYPHNDSDFSININNEKLSTWYVKNWYLMRSHMATPRYKYRYIIGSGSGPQRDGYGLYAKFSDPVSACLSEDRNYLIVLDKGANKIIKVDLMNNFAKTIIDLNKINIFKGIKFSKIAVLNDLVYLLSADGKNLTFLDNKGNYRSLLKYKDDDPNIIVDIKTVSNLLFILDVGARYFSIYDTAANKNKIISEFENESYNLIGTTRSSIMLMSSKTGSWKIFDIKNMRFTVSGVLGPGFDNISDSINSKSYYILSKGSQLFNFKVNNKGSQQFDKKSQFNFDGIEIGDPNSPYAYQHTPYASATTILLNEENKIFVLDKKNKRLLKIENLYQQQVKGKLLFKAFNNNHQIGPNYLDRKEKASNRILWISHSVYWDPAGFYFPDDLAYGAPVILQKMLNERTNVMWQVINAGLTGVEFYTSAYSRVKDTLNKTEIDYVFITIDMQNILWFLQFNGLTIPALYNKVGVPVGVDITQNNKPIFEREYHNKLSKLMHYIIKNYGPDKPNRLIGDDGKIVKDATLNIWNKDNKFREILANIYIDLVNAINKECKKHNVKLIVFIAPTTNFIGQQEWWDAYGLGGSEKNYDFEKVHSFFLAELIKKKINCYDLSYDMLILHAKNFPYNAISHHRSYMMHRSLAMSILRVITDQRAIDINPIERSFKPNSKKTIAKQIMYLFSSIKNNKLHILHDLISDSDPKCSIILKKSNNARKSAIDLIIKDIKELMISGTNFSSIESICADFVNIKNKDDYGVPDIRDYKRVASICIKNKYINEIINLINQKRNNIDQDAFKFYYY